MKLPQNVPLIAQLNDPSSLYRVEENDQKKMARELDFERRRWRAVEEYDKKKALNCSQRYIGNEVIPADLETDIVNRRQRWQQKLLRARPRI